MAKRPSHIRQQHRAVIRRTGAPCHLCGQPIDYNAPYLDPGEFVVDHVIPLAAGGTDSLANKRAAHRACNRQKGSKPTGGPIRRSATLKRPGEAPPPRP